MVLLNRQANNPPAGKRMKFSQTRRNRQTTPGLRATAVIFLLLAALLLAPGWLLFRQYEVSLRDAQISQARNRLTLAERTIQTEFNRMVSDIRALAMLPTLPQLIGTKALEPSHRLVNYLSQILLSDKRYDQLRVLDRQGHELMRIVHRQDRTFHIRPSELRDRSDATYYREAGRLLPGQIHVSPFSRNAGVDAIENPNIPIIRLAAQIQNNDGQAVGMMILDYNVQGLVDSIASLADTAPEQTLVVLDASDGWLVSINAKQQTSPVNGGSTPPPLADVHPELWNTPSGVPVGTTKLDDGVYLRQGVAPLDLDPDVVPNAYRNESLGVPPGLAESYRWDLVAFIPRDAWLHHSTLGSGTALALVTLVLLLLAVVSHESASAWVYKRRLQEESAAHTHALEDLYENAPCGYHTLDADGVVRRMNQTELKWLGYTREDVMGRRRYANFVHPNCQADYAAAFEAFRSGAPVVDYRLTLLRKDGSSFPAAIHATQVLDENGQLLESRATLVDITDRDALENELKRQASTDPLTNLANRRHFLRQAEHHMAQARLESHPLTLLMIDVDRFKSINDTWGHDAGDQVLRAIASRCLDALRPTDLLARLGGEEFAVLLPHASEPEAQQVAQRLVHAIGGERLVLDNALTLPVTVSIGLALMQANDTEPGDLMKRADQRLYEAKAAGRNCWR